MILTEKDKVRFLSKVRKGAEPDDCWEWEAGLMWNGYGRFTMHSHPYRAHRIAYELFVGHIPEGLCVLHRCDNRSCIRPDHLWLGTRGDNNTDCARKGRKNILRGEDSPFWGTHHSAETNQKNREARQGTKCYNAKLTEEQVREIRASTLSQSELGRIYGVARTTIEHIKIGDRWKHLV
jgi:hypothetical protein